MCHKLTLCIDHLLYVGTVVVEHLVITLGHRAGNDERCAGVVNEHGVNLVDNRIIVLALNHIIRRHRHIVAEIVKAKLIVCAKGNVAVICRATGRCVRLMLVDAVNG